MSVLSSMAGLPAGKDDMSEYCGQSTHHTKCRGQFRHCSWCGQTIEVGEHYAKWLYFDAGRDTVYAHEECASAWMEAANEEGGICYANGDDDRPTQPKQADASRKGLKMKLFDVNVSLLLEAANNEEAENMVRLWLSRNCRQPELDCNFMVHYVEHIKDDSLARIRDQH